MAAAAGRQPAAERARAAGGPPGRPGSKRTAASPCEVTVQQATGSPAADGRRARRVEGDATVDYDPRTQGLSLAQRPVFTGLRYRLSRNPAPNGQQLSAAEGAVPGEVRGVPRPRRPCRRPSRRCSLKAPQAPYARLQALRAALYRQFIASGQGKPTDVDGGPRRRAARRRHRQPLRADRVRGAARALGRDSRAASGSATTTATAKDDGSVEFRPANAATYLEAYFAPYGWVPVDRHAAHARSRACRTTSATTTPSIQASPELGINVYLPVRQPDRLPLYAYARYFLVRALPVRGRGRSAAAALPGGAEAGATSTPARAGRRRTGRPAQVAVAYCELRDQMIDLALPGRGVDAAGAGRARRGGRGARRARLARHPRPVGRPAAEPDRARTRPTAVRLAASVRDAGSPRRSRRPRGCWPPCRGRACGRRTAPRCRTCGDRLRLRLPRLASPRTCGGLRPRAATSLLLVLVALDARRLLLGLRGRHASRTSPFPTRLAPTAVAGLRSTRRPRPPTPTSRGAGQGRHRLRGQGLSPSTATASCRRRCRWRSSSRATSATTRRSSRRSAAASATSRKLERPARPRAVQPSSTAASGSTCGSRP